MVAETIRELFDGNIGEFLTEETAVFGGIRELLSQQFERLSEMEQELMVWLAIEREAVGADKLRENLVQSVPRHTLFETLRSLRQRSLLETANAGQGAVRQQTTIRFSLQNVVMEYVTERLVDQMVEQVEIGATERLQRHARTGYPTTRICWRQHPQSPDPYAE